MAHHPSEGHLVVAVGRDITAKVEAQALEKKRLRGEADQARLLLSLYAQAPELSDDEVYKRVLDDAITLTGSAVGFFHLLADDERTIALTTSGHEALGSTQHRAWATAHSRRPASDELLAQERPVYYNDFATSPDREGLLGGTLGAALA